MKDIFLYFILAVIMTMQIFVFYELNYANRLLSLTLAGMPLAGEVLQRDRNTDKRY